MPIHALLNVYNDRTFLGACLESLIDCVDSIIVADGAYRLYYEHYKQFDPQATPWSNDGTLEIIEHFHPDIVLLDIVMSDLDGYEVVVGIGGGVSAYKVCQVVSRLVQRACGPADWRVPAGC